jgi:hypothetical protein
LLCKQDLLADSIETQTWNYLFYLKAGPYLYYNFDLLYLIDKHFLYAPEEKS